MIPASSIDAGQLKQAIKDEASRLGFVLAGFTSPDPPPHLSVFENWLAQGHQAGMDYMARDDARAKRIDPRRIMPECRTILALGIPYSNPTTGRQPEWSEQRAVGRVAAYAWGTDYHLVLPGRLKQIVEFVQRRVGQPVRSRCYTDTGPLLERELAQRAGLGWIGKNSCLINPRKGSYFLLAEILLDLELEPDTPFATDQCGSCTRCIEACPTECILPDRTLEAGLCISYLTIESRDEIPDELRPKTGNWVFGCDICQVVCPWNRFAQAEGDPAFRAQRDVPGTDLAHDMRLTPEEFRDHFAESPLKRPGRGGYLRNVAIALGNVGRATDLPVLQAASRDSDPMVSRHADWAIRHITAAEADDA